MSLFLHIKRTVISPTTQQNQQSARKQQLLAVLENKYIGESFLKSMASESAILEIQLGIKTSKMEKLAILKEGQKRRAILFCKSAKPFPAWGIEIE